MLDRPIDQSDIDNGTLFEVRTGVTVRVVKWTPNEFSGQERWSIDPAPVPWFTVRSNGCYHAGGWDGFYDLIARIKEPNMASQVVYEDKRNGQAKATVVRFDDIQNGHLFEYDGEVYRKLSNAKSGHNAERIAGRYPPGFAEFGLGGYGFMPLPHLRLRLVLENKEDRS